MKKVIASLCVMLIVSTAAAEMLPFGQGSRIYGDGAKLSGMLTVVNDSVFYGLRASLERGSSSSLSFDLLFYPESGKAGLGVSALGVSPLSGVTSVGVRAGGTWPIIGESIVVLEAASLLGVEIESVHGLDFYAYGGIVGLLDFDPADIDLEPRVAVGVTYQFSDSVSGFAEVDYVRDTFFGLGISLLL